MPFAPAPPPVRPRKPGKYFRENGELVPANKDRLKAIEELAECLDEDFNRLFVEMGGVAITERGSELVTDTGHPITSSMVRNVFESPQLSEQTNLQIDFACTRATIELVTSELVAYVATTTALEFLKLPEFLHCSAYSKAGLLNMLPGEIGYFHGVPVVTQLSPSLVWGVYRPLAISKNGKVAFYHLKPRNQDTMPPEQEPMEAELVWR